MATEVTLDRDPRATLTVPAHLIEDVRRAIVAEIDHDADWVKDTEDCEEDRAGALDHLRADVRLLDALAGATESTDLESGAHSLFHVLEAFIRQQTERLTEQIGYAPIEMAPTLEIVGRLQWAAQQAARLFPNGEKA